MNLETLKRDIKTRYRSYAGQDIDSKVASVADALNSEWSMSTQGLSLQELKTLASAMLEEEGQTLHDELEDLIAQKERLERQIIRKGEELQHLKYSLFDSLEKHIGNSDEMLEKLHQVKLQSVDLLDILEEITESAIITTLEKGSDIEDTLHEIIKDITFETLNANVLNAVRIRRILASILQSAINVAEATPNQSNTIFRGTLLGIRSALIKSIEKFHQYLLYVPEEVKALYRDEYKTIETELDRIDTLFTQVLNSLKSHNSHSIVENLERISNEIYAQSDELTNLSKETVELLRNRLSKIKRGVTMQGTKLLNSKSAQEAKAMGVRAWSVAKSAMEGAIKGAKDAMEKK
ncbi:hypothetical protein Sulku_2485 [Sulfuricurvum kujiense DSM 16994]|uniref:Uncharacterized protein n=1 Tax=Sulfuricurvum kujiense (strain ATCC BAA-921 / DSM 16994 / JCM 11577 / YK-1) TaxID=709032 RepID=E4TYY4_SULKY|nr:DUF6781 family protein [Sulfuricurvum kujiense]ADR35144.1 hypothetical protein Sulku_2485 [Sulfuricurvum kujiense DSM 16994]